MTRTAPPAGGPLPAGGGDAQPVVLPLAAGYDLYARIYDRVASPLRALEEPETLALCGAVRGARVLDLGCGTGRIGRALARQGAWVAGVDLSAGMLARAAARAAADRIRPVRGDLARLPVASAAFDLVVCALAVDHLDDLSPAFREMARVLRPSGRLVLSTVHPFFQWLAGPHLHFSVDGAAYLIPARIYAFGAYIAAAREAGLRIAAAREPVIDDALTEVFPHLHAYQGCPMVLVLELRPL